MSAETDLRAALVAHAALTALVGQRIAQNSVPEGATLPFVVFSAQHSPVEVLWGPAPADDVSFTLECWAKTALMADAVADAAVAALAASATAQGAAATMLSRASGYDAELGLDATVLTVSWWA